MRRYPSYPIPAVGVIVMKGDEILLVRRAAEPAKGEWSVPGGIIELGEKMRDAARREVREETGLDVEIDDVLDVVDNISYDESGRVQFHYALVDFLAHPVGGRLKASSDAAEARWVRISDLDKYDLTKILRDLLIKKKIVTPA
jgi:mutator protein MutT